MKILITGANGFIGRNLVAKLRDKYTIAAPGRQILDLMDTKAVETYLKENQFDVIIHTANINNSILPYEVLKGNLRMFFNLERCKGRYGKMYYFGSGAEYDMEHYVPDMKEEYFGTYIPKEPYGFSKYVMSAACGKDNDIYDLRLFGVYGKYEKWERRFISNAICRALKGKDITIQKNVYFDYLWVDDLADIMEWFIENNPIHRHYNVCRGKRIDLYSLACMVKEILHINCDIVIGEEGWKKEYTGNNARLLKEIGNYKFTEFEKAIHSLCEFYKANIDTIDETRLI